MCLAAYRTVNDLQRGTNPEEPVAPPKHPDPRQTERRNPKESDKHKAPPPEYGHEVVRE